MRKSTIAIIGAGNMGTSLVGGIITNGYSPEIIFVSDPTEEKLSEIQAQFGVNTTTHNLEAIQTADIIILAVKPQSLKKLCAELKPIISSNKPLIISVAAGIRETTLASWLGETISIVRCMPNTPALIGCGASALFANDNVSNEHREIAEEILAAVGVVVWIDDENQMDVITALSGSGPAYFFLVMEALQDAAEKLGLDKKIAQLLTIQTSLGAAKMALDSNVSLEVLRQRVTSPGGTTASAIASLQKNKLESIFAEALIAAKNRSEELAMINDPTLEKN